MQTVCDEKGSDNYETKVFAARTRAFAWVGTAYRYRVKICAMGKKLAIDINGVMKCRTS